MFMNPILETERAPSYTNAFILELAKKNPVFRQTIMYKEKSNNDIRAFKQKLYVRKNKSGGGLLYTLQYAMGTVTVFGKQDR